MKVTAARFPKLEEVSAKYREALTGVETARDKLQRIEKRRVEALTMWKQSIRGTDEPLDLEAILAGEDEQLPGEGEAERRFRAAQALARQARTEFQAAETTARNVRLAEAGALLQAEPIRAAREPALNDMLAACDEILAAAARLRSADDWLSRELGSGTAGNRNTVRLDRLEVALDVVRRLRDELAAEIE